MKRLLILMTMALVLGALGLGLAADSVIPAKAPQLQEHDLLRLAGEPVANPPKKVEPTRVIRQSVTKEVVQDVTPQLRLLKRLRRLQALRGFAAELDKQGKEQEAKVVRQLLRRPIRVVDGKLVNLLDYVEAELAPCLPPQHQSSDGGVAWPAPGDWQQFFEMLMEYLPQIIELIITILALF